MKNRTQRYMDFNTVPEYITMITVYAGGTRVLKDNVAFFGAYKYYKLGPVTIKLVPASTLPVTPTELSTSDSTKTDPRDLMTPGMVRITNGEDFAYDIDNSTGKGANQYERRAIYDTMTLDPRWFKWNLQRGIVKTAYPRFWVLGQTRQDYYPGSIINVPAAQGGEFVENYSTTGATQLGIENENDSNGLILNSKETINFSSDRGIIQTGEHGRMGWLPTDAVIERGWGTNYFVSPSVNNIPEVELFRVLLPPAYHTKFYYRMFISETVYFRGKVLQGPEVMGPNPSDTSQMMVYRVQSLDRFLRPKGIEAKWPNYNQPLGTVIPTTPTIPNNLQGKHKETEQGP